VLVAIEGIDGAGKRTQAALLADRMRQNGLTSAILSFPRYGETVFARAVADYLNGKFGPLHAVDPHLAALLFAGDRFESKAHLLALAAAHDVLILDRYVASNLAHQAARLPPDARPAFIDWLAAIEYGVYGLPRADVTLLLDLAVETAAALVRGKGPRGYTTRPADLHEQDLAYLAETRRVYQALAETGRFGAWHVVPCTATGGGVRAAAAIHADIWHALGALLPQTGSARR